MKDIAIHEINSGVIDPGMDKGSDLVMLVPAGIARLILDKVEVEEFGVFPDEMELGKFNVWK